MDKTQEIIFESIVRITWYWDSEGVASTGDIKRRTEISKYMILKNIKLLMEQGLLTKGVRSGGYDEYSDKVYPPLRGYKLTEKAKELEWYKVIKADEDRRFEEAFCV